MNMSICHLITSLKQGGAQEILLQIIKNTDETIEHTVCTIGPEIADGENELRPAFEKAGATVVDFGATSRLDVTAFSNIFRFLKANEFQILHAHSIDANLVGRVFGTAAGIEAIISTHHIVPSEYHPVLRFPDAVTTPLDTATVAVSDGVKDHFLGNQSSFFPDFDKQWKTIYNGIDVSQFAERVAMSETSAVMNKWGISSDDTVLLSVGRCSPVKRQSDIIKAALPLLEDKDDIHLFVIGTGETEHELRRQASNTPFPDRIHVTGFVESTSPYYRIADVFVSASIREGLPMTHLEAMSAKLPIVTTDIPGVREVVVDGETGLLVPPRSPTEITAALSRTLSNTEIDFGQNGFERAVGDFDISQTVASYENLYKQCIEPRY